MGHRLVVAAAFTAASLLTSGAYAGSPYYDANGEMAAQPLAPVHVRTPRLARTPVAAKSKAASVAAVPGSSGDGLAPPAADAEAFDHAVGSDGSTVASGEAAPDPKAAPIYSAAMPKMDPDGFEHRESKSSLFEHAVGSDGSAAEAVEAPAAPKAQPVYTAAMPKMDADGFQSREGNSSFYGHAVGSDGSP